MQLSFLEDTTNLSQEVAELKKTQENVRKGLFQRYNLMQKEMEEMRQELRQIKSQIYNQTDELLEDFGVLQKVQ